MSKPNIIQLSEFDVTQKIIESLCNICIRAVLFSVRDNPKDATQIAEELNLSLSTVYKTLSNLEDLALVEIERFIISPEGKKIKQYKSRIGKVEILLAGTEPRLNLYPNTSGSKSD
ncbi:MAG: winged helix-turn-helix domain-containing protein [Thaumarchaeota archaeon]|nr:winged helix-turn-helix domain-containing protein [Nitrososphaerota archaeon]